MRPHAVLCFEVIANALGENRGLRCLVLWSNHINAAGINALAGLSPDPNHAL